MGPVDGHPISAFICYEAIFPDLVREFVGRGAQLLVNITNDGWYGRTSAPYQHFAMAKFRAVENERYLVRAANTGITAVVDPHGRVLERTELFEPTVLVRDVPLLAGSTFYTRHGDVFAWACLGGAVALTAAGRGNAGPLPRTPADRVSVNWTDYAMPSFAVNVAAAGRGRSSGTRVQPGSAPPIDRRHARPVVLLVDDLADQRELYRQYLEFAGYDVAVARDGFEAVDCALRVHPDVVIMDLAMPGMDGFETTQRLKLLEATRGIPVIALTAHGELPREWALTAGCAAYLKKPCYPHDLAVEISSVLDKAHVYRPQPALRPRRARSPPRAGRGRQRRGPGAVRGVPRVSGLPRVREPHRHRRPRGRAAAAPGGHRARPGRAAAGWAGTSCGACGGTPSRVPSPSSACRASLRTPSARMRGAWGRRSWPSLASRTRSISR